MKKIAFVLTLSTLLTLSFSGQANTARFAKWDKNADGKVSVEEFAAKSKKKDKAIKRFEKLDTNKDGYLSAEEAELMSTKKKKN